VGNGLGALMPFKLQEAYSSPFKAFHRKKRIVYFSAPEAALVGTTQINLFPGSLVFLKWAGFISLA
jgi:hypothetical protein